MVDALIFTACYSRHCFVWLSHRQTTSAVIEGFEAAWRFFGGVFAVVIPDNLKAIVTEADDVDPRFNDAFLEYAQSRGFVIDPARVRSPKDKPRVERQVQYVRGSFFAGETFVDLADAQRRAETWCSTTAGLRVHGTTQHRPLENFRLEEAPVLLPAPTEAYDLPLYAKPKVHRDHHLLTELLGPAGGRRRMPCRARRSARINGCHRGDREESFQPSVSVMTSTERAWSSSTSCRRRREFSNQAR